MKFEEINNIKLGIVVKVYGQSTQKSNTSSPLQIYIYSTPTYPLISRPYFKQNFVMALFPFVCCLIVIIVSQAKAIFECDNNRGNYTVNSTYDNNLKTLLYSFSSHTEINYGFYNFSYGQHPDKIKAIGLCRGDLEPNQCRRNLNNSIAYLRAKCPNQKEAILWGDDFTLRYTYRSILGSLETDPTRYFSNTMSTTEADKYIEPLSFVMRSLTDKAASGDSRRKYEADGVNTTDFSTIYGLVQCMPDLSSQQCSNCLYTAISDIDLDPFDRYHMGLGGEVVKPSCRLRFDTYRFYNSTIELESLSLQPSPSLPPSAVTNNTSLGLFTAP